MVKVIYSTIYIHRSPDAAPRPAANLLLLESLDNGLTGLTLYFAYGIYALFLSNSMAVGTAPHWLKVENIDREKTLLEVVAVLLAIMFVRTLAEKMILDGQSIGPGWRCSFASGHSGNRNQ